jgi:hypothetical protein
MTERRLLLAAMSTLLVVLLPAREALGAEAQRPLTEAIDVHPGATCVEAGALAEQVGVWLGAETADADVWVRVAGSDDDPRTVSFEMGRGDRLLARRRFAPGPERCDHLQAALGLAIALAIRVSLLDEIVGPKQPAPERPANEPREPWAVGVGAVVAFGVLPGTSLGAGIRAERELPPNFALRLGVMGLSTWNQTFATVSGSFDAEIVALRLDACVRLDLTPRLTGSGCAGFLAGGLLSQGRDFVSSRSAASLWTAAAEAVEIGYRAGKHWSLDAEVSLVLPLRRTQVQVLSGAGDVKEARALSSAGVTMTVGPAYRF